MADTTDETSNFPNAAVIKVLEQLLALRFGKETYTYVINEATTKGDNYIGVVYRVAVTCNKEKAQQEEQKFSLILKVPPQNPIRRKQFFARPSFIRESLAYEQFLPLLAEYQKGKALPKAATFHEYPLCYASRIDEMNEAIFLEDLQIHEYKLHNRFEELSKELVTLVMRTYGKLHACSFAIKDQDQQKLAPFKTLVDIFEQRKDDINLATYFEELKKSSLASLDATQDKHYYDVLEKYYAESTFFDRFLTLIDSSQYEPYAVVCHGDCWINNFMFKHDAQSDTLVDVRLIDWQVMRYASPFCDLMYFLFTCTTQKFRQAHYRDMLNVYYDELTAHIKRLGSEPSVLFPRNAFEEEEHSKGALGLLFAMIVLPIITMKSEDMPSLDELSEIVEAGNAKKLKDAGLIADDNKAYNQRMREVIIDCVDHGYI